MSTSLAQAFRGSRSPINEEIEIRCHYGNQVLEIAEAWVQEDRLIISVYAVPTEDLKDKTNQI